MEHDEKRKLTAQNSNSAEKTDCQAAFSCCHAGLKTQNIINAIPGGVAIYRVSDIFETVYYSDGVAALTGYTPEEYREKICGDAAEMTHPEDTARVIREVRNALEKNLTADLDFRKFHRDGSVVWVHMQGQKIGEDRGFPLFQCVFHNITRQKETELALRERTAMYDLAIKNADITIWTYDIHTGTLYQTEQSQAVHPGSPMVVPNFVETAVASGEIRPESIEDFRELYRRVEAGESEVSKDIWYSRADGGWWCEHIVYTNLTDENGKILHSIGIGRNITEETRERIKRQQLDLALTTTSICSCVYDIKSRLIQSEARCAAQQGFAEGEACTYEQRIAAGIVMPESAEDYRALYRALERGEKTAAAMIHYDKKRIPAEWKRITYSTIFDPDGTPTVSVGIGEDVTELMTARKKYAQEMNTLEVAQGENLFAKCIINVTKNRTERHISKDILCYDKATDRFSHMVQQVAAFCRRPEERRLFEQTMSPQNLQTQFEGGQSNLTLEYQTRMRNGDYCWVRSSAQLHRDPESGDLMCFLYTYNIDREKTFQTMLERVVDLDYDYIASLDHLNNTYTLYQHQVSGAPQPPFFTSDYEHEVEQYAREFVADEDVERNIREMSYDNLFHQLETQAVYTTFVGIKMPDGSIAHKKLCFSYMDRDRRSILITRTDITEILDRDARQRQVLKTALEQAQQASVAKTEFLSRMSHEIRTPMNAIIGMSALAAQCVNDPKQVADCISKVGISARFLLSLINDILDMSRIESGRVVLKNEKILFEPFLNGINTIAYELAENAGVEYDCVVTGFTETAYMGDAMKLQQVMINLISNAIKFTPAGGSVQFIVHQASAEGHRTRLRLTVNDNGIGISESFLPKIFEPFEQEHAGATNPYGGTGLGLAICKNLIELMGGTISVNSIEGIGSEFVVELPMEICPEATEHVLNNRICWSHLSALIVDDEVMICEQTKRILDEMNVRAEWVDSGAAAVRLVRQKKSCGEAYDIILVDWRMPEMNGIETARQIRQIVGPDVTIIIMTAYDWALIEDEAKRAGVNLLISKPLFKNSLSSAFEKVYRGKEEEKQAAVAPEYDFTGRRVLLVEDHPLNIEVAKRLLMAKGFEVEVAENGLAAIELFTLASLGHFDAILMDIRMPVMDGLTAAHAIRQLHKKTAATIPIIAMSANAFEEDVEKSKAAGMNAHLAKPIEPERLYATLKKYICE